jgi:hypothetical protein
LKPFKNEVLRKIFRPQRRKGLKIDKYGIMKSPII